MKRPAMEGMKLTSETTTASVGLGPDERLGRQPREGEGPATWSRRGSVRTVEAFDSEPSKS